MPLGANLGFRGAKLWMAIIKLKSFNKGANVIVCPRAKDSLAGQLASAVLREYLLGHETGSQVLS